MRRPRRRRPVGSPSSGREQEISTTPRASREFGFASTDKELSTDEPSPDAITALASHLRRISNPLDLDSELQLRLSTTNIHQSQAVSGRELASPNSLSMSIHPFICGEWHPGPQRDDIPHVPDLHLCSALITVGRTRPHYSIAMTRSKVPSSIPSELQPQQPYLPYPNGSI